MKRTVKIVISLLLIITLMTGCAQSTTKSLGGTMTITLEPNQKLEMFTWKESDLWYLTRPMTENDIAETHMFKQSRDVGLLEGSVIIIEVKE